MEQAKSNLIEDIRNKLQQIESRVELEGFGGFVLNELLKEKNTLQEELNRLLNKKIVLTETEADAIYEKLRLEKKQTLQNQTKINTLGIVTAVLIIAGLAYFIYKKPKP